MVTADGPVDDEFSPEEAARRRDEVTRRMANTPPQPRVSPHPEEKRKPAGHLQ